MPIDKELEKDFKFYKNQDKSWYQENYGKFVLIKNQKIINIYNCYPDTLKEGINKFGEEKFLIQQIGIEDNINYNTFSLIGEI